MSVYRKQEVQNLVQAPAELEAKWETLPCAPLVLCPCHCDHSIIITFCKAVYSPSCPISWSPHHSYLPNHHIRIWRRERAGGKRSKKLWVGGLPLYTTPGDHNEPHSHEEWSPLSWTVFNLHMRSWWSRWDLMLARWGCFILAQKGEGKDWYQNPRETTPITTTSYLGMYSNLTSTYLLDCPRLYCTILIWELTLHVDETNYIPITSF